MVWFAFDSQDKQCKTKWALKKHKVFAFVNMRVFGAEWIYKKEDQDPEILWFMMLLPGKYSAPAKQKIIVKKTKWRRGCGSKNKPETGVFADPGGICYNGVSCVLDMKYLKTSLLRLLLTQTFFVVFLLFCSVHPVVLIHTSRCFVIIFHFSVVIFLKGESIIITFS